MFRLTPSEYLSQNEIDAASLVRSTEFNAQHQKRITWPANAVVARAYLDQLARSNGILPARAREVKTALDRAEKIHNARDKGAAAVTDGLNALATELESDAAAAAAPDAARLRWLATTVRGRSAGLR